MLELEVVLDFVCCICHHSLGVTLKCEGEGLAQSLDDITTVKVACPTCNSINQVYFTPGGSLVHVCPERKVFGIPEPSVN